MPVRLEAVSVGPRVGRARRGRLSAARMSREVLEAWRRRQCLCGALRRIAEASGGRRRQTARAATPGAAQRNKRLRDGEVQARRVVMEVQAVAAELRDRKRRRGGRGAKRSSGYVGGTRRAAEQPRKRPRQGQGAADVRSAGGARNAAQVRAAEARRRRAQQRRDRLRQWLGRRKKQLQAEAAGRHEELELFHRMFMLEQTRRAAEAAAGAPVSSVRPSPERLRGRGPSVVAFAGRGVKRSRGEAAVAAARRTRFSVPSFVQSRASPATEP